MQIRNDGELKLHVYPDRLTERTYRLEIYDGKQLIENKIELPPECDLEKFVRAVKNTVDMWDTVYHGEV